MACGGGLTGLVMTAAGAAVTNGALSGVFGAAPLSSLAGVDLSVVDSVTGQALSPTLNTMVSSISGITGGGGVLSGLDGALSSLGSFSTDSMISAFNGITDGLADGALFDAIGGFAPEVNSLLTSASGAGLNNALGYATSWAGQTLGGSGSLVGGVLTGDPKKFGTILSAASGYVDTANQFINAATNSDFLGSTFNGMNDIISGGLASVNLDVGNLGADLSKLGSTINFDSIGNLGNPGQLLANLDTAGTLGPMFDAVANIQIDEATAKKLGASVTSFVSAELQSRGGTLPLQSFGVDIAAIAQQGAGLPDAFQAKVFEEFAGLDETKLSQVKAILGNTQEQIKSGVDLLDPTKLFPNSFDTFTTPLRTASVGFRAVYEDTAGTVNSQLNNLGGKLKNILPEDLAVANDAISRSFRQVKNIDKTTSTALGTATSNLESLKDLTLLEDQEDYVPTDVKNYWLQQYGVDSSNDVQLATGNAGQLTLSDVIGFAAGYNSAAPLKQNKELLEEMAANGDLDDITGSTGIYQTLTKFGNGDFGPSQANPGDPWVVTIPAGYVGEGTYSQSTSDAAKEDAFINGIIPDIKTILNSFASNSNAQLIVRNSKRYNQQLAREYLNQQRIDNVDLTSIPSNDTVAIQFAQNLPNLGLDTSEGGTAELLERIVDFSSKGGQAMIAAMREGRNLQRLSQANISQDTGIDTDGVQDPATLATSQYTKEEAQSRIIRS